MADKQEAEKEIESATAKKKQIKKSPFYKLWWFWLIIGIIFIASWSLFFIKDLNIRNSIIGILGIWGSTVATIFIGIIAAKQNENLAFNTRKQQLLNDVNESLITFNQCFYKICDLQFIYTIKKEIEKLPHLNGIEFEKARKEIVHKIIEFSHILDEFDNNLLKSILGTEDFIEFTENAREIEYYFDKILNVYSNKEKKLIKNEDYKNFISEWLITIIPLKSSVSKYGLNLKKRILVCTTLKELNIIEQEITNNQQALLK